MLLMTLRMLTAIRTLGLAESVRLEVAAKAREAGRTAGLFSLAGVLVLLGTIFVSAAAMLGLATVWPAHWAALAVGGVLILAGGAILFSVRQDSGRRQEPPPPPSPPPAAMPAPDLSAAMRPVEDWVRQHPGAATAAAIGLGVLAGFLSNCEKGPDETESGSNEPAGRPSRHG
jgi:hypothetical protein